MRHIQKIKNHLINNKHSGKWPYNWIYSIYRAQYFFVGYLRSLAEEKKIIPRLNEFTLDGQMKVAYWHIDNSYSSDEPLVYTTEEINHFRDNYLSVKKVHYYGITDLWLHDALTKYSISNKKTAIIGSVTPYYESMVLHYGGLPKTVEYNPITMKDERLEYVSVDNFLAQKGEVYDMAMSISSYEHDGLGRYGEPLDPNADLKSMSHMHDRLKTGGLLFLVLPVGQDTLVWNAHRIYGPVRLAKILEGWEMVDSFGFSEKLHKQWNCNGRRTTQPVFVLRKI